MSQDGGKDNKIDIVQMSPPADRAAGSAVLRHVVSQDNPHISEAAPPLHPLSAKGVPSKSTLTHPSAVETPVTITQPSISMSDHKISKSLSSEHNDSKSHNSTWRNPGQPPTSDPTPGHIGLFSTANTSIPVPFSSRDHFIPQYPDQTFAALGPLHNHPPPLPTRIGRNRCVNSPNWTLSANHEIAHNPPLAHAGSRNAAQMSVNQSGIHSPSPQSPSQYKRHRVTDNEDIRSETPAHNPHLKTPIETHKLNKEVDTQGRKTLNNYTLLERLGSGQHGTVKLGKNIENDEYVAVKIVRRFSKKRLGKKSDPADMIRKEVAILKKARHPHVVSLYEVIDDREFAKVYLVLEYVERGEIIWRKQADRAIALFEKARLAREQKNGYNAAHARRAIDEFNAGVAQRRQMRSQRWEVLKHSALERLAAAKRPCVSAADGFWSLEYGGDSEHEYSTFRHVDHEDERMSRADLHISETAGMAATRYGRPNPSTFSIQPRSFQFTNDSQSLPRSLPPSMPPSEPSSVPPSQPSSRPVSRPVSRPQTPPPLLGDDLASSFLQSKSQANTDLEFQTMMRRIIDEDIDREWTNDMEDCRYAPCLTISQCLDAFRDTVLGLEYLHYQGIIHRDIKPANLLWTREYTVKISDFGVSYLGKPVREDSGTDDGSEKFDEELELAKTVGTPAFYAPELCSPDLFDPEGKRKRPEITGAIDVWALGVTLYGMVFGRLPFFDTNEFRMYEKIAHEEVFIPRLRLRGVVHTDQSSAYYNVGQRPDPRPRETDKRAHDVLEYDFVEDSLADLLKRLLAKDYRERISLKEVKLHPWVVSNIENVEDWLDTTDISRQAEGKKIEISTQEVQDAIVNLTIFDRVAKGVQRLGSVLRGRRPSRKRTDSIATTATSRSKTDDRRLSRGFVSGEEQHIFAAALKHSREGVSSAPPTPPISATGSSASMSGSGVLEAGQRRSMLVPNLPPTGDNLTPFRQKNDHVMTVEDSMRTVTEPDLRFSAPSSQPHQQHHRYESYTSADSVSILSPPSTSNCEMSPASAQSNFRSRIGDMITSPSSLDEYNAHGVALPFRHRGSAFGSLSSYDDLMANKRDELEQRKLSAYSQASSPALSRRSSRDIQMTLNRPSDLSTSLDLHAEPSLALSPMLVEGQVDPPALLQRQATSHQDTSSTSIQAAREEDSVHASGEDTPLPPPTKPNPLRQLTSDMPDIIEASKAEAPRNLPSEQVLDPLKTSATVPSTLPFSRNQKSEISMSVASSSSRLVSGDGDGNEGDDEREDTDLGLHSRGMSELSDLSSFTTGTDFHGSVIGRISSNRLGSGIQIFGQKHISGLIDSGDENEQDGDAHMHMHPDDDDEDEDEGLAMVV